MEKEFSKLDKIISALLATHSASILTTESGKARAAGIFVARYILSTMEMEEFPES
jgi:hypothetical protein